MREILFRGKRIDNGEWVEGSFVNLWMVNYKKYQPLITDNEAISYEIDPETVGQYTGLTDKNGKRIFEGDILTICSASHFEMTGEIVFIHGGFELYESENEIYECLWYESQEMTVIGNTHDNPELLRGE